MSYKYSFEITFTCHSAALSMSLEGTVVQNGVAVEIICGNDDTEATFRCHPVLIPPALGNLALFRSDAVLLGFMLSSQSRFFLVSYMLTLRLLLLWLREISFSDCLSKCRAYLCWMCERHNSEEEYAREWETMSKNVLKTKQLQGRVVKSLSIRFLFKKILISPFDP